MTIEPRFVSPQFLANHCDAVVTHHWENGLNYLYYEVLYGGYPLIHNSEFLKDYGYYYDDFDAESGADALLSARAEHDRRTPPLPSSQPGAAGSGQPGKSSKHSPSRKPARRARRRRRGRALTSMTLKRGGALVRRAQDLHRGL